MNDKKSAYYVLPQLFEVFWKLEEVEADNCGLTPSRKQPPGKMGADAITLARNPAFFAKKMLL